MAGARALWRATGMSDAGLREADRRHRQQLHAVRSWSRAPARRRAAREEGHRRVGRLGRGVQHHRGRRRDRHGARRDAVLAPEPRAHRRQRRVHGQRALRRRAGVHLELRQIYAGDAPRRGAAQRPDHLRVGRAHGGGQAGRDPRPRRQGHHPEARSHRSDDRRGRLQGERRRPQGPRALGLPHVRILLRHVHRQQHELPERSDRPGAARQRDAAGDSRHAVGALRARRPPHRGPREAPLRGG